MSISSPSAVPAQPLNAALAKTKQVKNSLDVASAELILTNEVLAVALPEEAKDDAVVARALEHNLEVEARVQTAARELVAVTKLLKAEEAYSHRLEKVIEKSGSSDAA